MSELKQNNKKRKLVENSKLFKEFKGIDSLNCNSANEGKIQKLDNLSNINNTAHDITKPAKYAKKTYILLENIDASVRNEDLQKYFSENGVSCDRVCLVPGPLAVTFFKREKDVDRLFNICQGLHYKSNELLMVKSSIKGPDFESNTTNLSDVAVHLKNLEEKTTEEDISALMTDPSKVQGISINTIKRVAIIDFLDAQSAKECIQKLDAYKLGENILKASFLVKTQRPDQFTLKITNLPHGFNKVDIRDAFPLTTKIKVIKGLTRHVLINFKSLEDLETVLNNPETVYIKGVPVKIEELIKTKKSEKKANFVLSIFNMPFDTTLQEIKALYPKVRFIDMQKNPDGMFIGSAKLNFDEKEACEEALKTTKGVTLKHRKIRAEMKFENVASKEDNESDLDE